MPKRKQWTQGGETFAFTVEAFATAHSIGRTTTFNEVKCGRLKARKVNGRTVITVEDAQRWRESLPFAGEAA